MSPSCTPTLSRSTHPVLDKVQVQHRHVLGLDNVLDLQDLHGLDLHEAEPLQLLADALRLLDARRERAESAAWSGLGNDTLRLKWARTRTLCRVKCMRALVTRSHMPADKLLSAWLCRASCHTTNAFKHYSRVPCWPIPHASGNCARPLCVAHLFASACTHRCTSAVARARITHAVCGIFMVCTMSPRGVIRWRSSGMHFRTLAAVHRRHRRRGSH